jgi:hypothetical protein
LKLGVTVEISGAHAGGSDLHDLAQHRRNDAAGLPHDLDLPGRLHLDAAPSFLDAGAAVGNEAGSPAARRLGAGQKIGEKIHARGARREWTWPDSSYQ